MNDFEIKDGVLEKYTGSDAHVVVPAVVKKIAYKAFAYNKTLKSITLPVGLEVIDDFAFNHCRSLGSIEIPGSVKVISTSIFVFCDNLKSVKLNEGLKEIDWWGFDDCRYLEEIDIPNTVYKVGPYAFQGCDSIKEIKMTKKLFDNIDENAKKYNEDIYKYLGIAKDKTKIIIKGEK